MRILVTGAAGFVGQRLCRVLAGQGHEVTALVHPDSMQRAEGLLAPFTRRILAADLGALSVADLPRAADALITLAQARHFRDFPATAEETFAVNVLANLQLVRWAMDAGVRRIVHASSGGIYGGRKDAHLQESDLLAVDSPLGFYLGSKLCSEIVVQNFRPLFGGVVILRPFFIYGPRQQAHMFVARMIDSVRTGRPVRLQGPDGLRTNPIYLDDAVQAFAGAIALEGAHVINVAGRDVVSLRDMCERIGAEVGRAPVFETVDGAPVDYVADTAQAEQKLGLELTPFLTGLRATLRGGPHD